MRSPGQRKLGAGRMPDRLVELHKRAGAGVLVADEKIVVACYVRNLIAPRRYAVGKVRLYAGAVVLTRTALGLSIGRQLLIHSPFQAQPRSPLTFTVADDGVHLYLDIGAATARGSRGRLHVHARAHVAPGLAASLPPGPWSVPITARGAVILVQLLAA